jgi:hypothetical protein
MTAAVGMIAGVGVANGRGHSCPMANPAKNSASERRTHGPRDDPLFLFGLVSARTVRLLLEGTLVSGKHSLPRRAEAIHSSVAFVPFGAQEIECLHGMSQVRDDDAPTDHQRDLHCIVEFRI